MANLSEATRPKASQILSVKSIISNKWVNNKKKPIGE
jgi:hypothetical protein